MSKKVLRLGAIRISEPKKEKLRPAGDRVEALGPPLWSRMSSRAGSSGGERGEGDHLPSILDIIC